MGFLQLDVMEMDQVEEEEVKTRTIHISYNALDRDDKRHVRA